MKILKRVLLVLAAIVILLSIIGLFLPSTAHIERSIVVNAPIETVYAQVNVLKNWEKWSPWQKMDPTSKVTYNEIPAGLGASYNWDGEKMGKGKLTIDSLVENAYLRTKLQFSGEGDDASHFKFEKEGTGTKVTWVMDMNYGWNIVARYFGVIMINDMLDKNFEDGLNSIKDVAEHAPVATESGAAYKVQVVDNINIEALYVPKKGTDQTVNKMLEEAFGEVQSYIDKNKIKTMGAPFAIYDIYNPGGLVELRAGIPVEKATDAGAIKAIQLKYPHALKVDYYGGYSGMMAAHDAIDKWATANNRKIIGVPWEVYVSGPDTEKDSTKWLTEILYPVE